MKRLEIKNMKILRARAPKALSESALIMQGGGSLEGVSTPEKNIILPRVKTFRCSRPSYISFRKHVKATITIFLPRLPVVLMHFTVKKSKWVHWWNHEPGPHPTAIPTWNCLVVDEMSDTSETCAGETHRRKLKIQRKKRLPYSTRFC